MATRRLSGLLAFVALCLLLTQPRMVGRTDLNLSVDGDMFAINGTPTFLVIASYFDAIHGDLGEIDEDFADLAADGFNGVRILPNWFRETGNHDSATKYMAQDTLFDYGGGLRSATLAHLLAVLDKAKDHDLIVDLSFTAETVVDCEDCESGTSALTFAEYKDALEAITTELDGYGSAYNHVMFDVQNEYDGNGPNDRDLDEDDINELVEAVHAIDASRIAFASLGYGIDPDDAATMANTAEIDVAPLHELRVCGWGNDSDYRVDTMEGITSLPIYFQESPRYRTNTDPTDGWFSSLHLEKSLYEAKSHGAAAWNFHTRASMNLNGTLGDSICDELVAEESDFVTTNLAATLGCYSCPDGDIYGCGLSPVSPVPNWLNAQKLGTRLLRAARTALDLF